VPKGHGLKWPKGGDARRGWKMLQEAWGRTFLERAFHKFTSAKKSKSALENVFIKSCN
jgi:hypothetical protein